MMVVNVGVQGTMGGGGGLLLFFYNKCHRSIE